MVYNLFYIHSKKVRIRIVRLDTRQFQSCFFIANVSSLFSSGSSLTPASSFLLSSFHVPPSWSTTTSYLTIYNGAYVPIHMSVSYLLATRYFLTNLPRIPLVTRTNISSVSCRHLLHRVDLCCLIVSSPHNREVFLFYCGRVGKFLHLEFLIYIKLYK